MVSRELGMPGWQDQPGSSRVFVQVRKEHLSSWRTWPQAGPPPPPWLGSLTWHPTRTPVPGSPARDVMSVWPSLHESGCCSTWSGGFLCEKGDERGGPRAALEGTLGVRNWWKGLQRTEKIKIKRVG